jgi:hypothetical protein
MLPIRANQLAGLEWSQPSGFSRRYELKAGDTKLAELAFQKTFGTLAQATTAEAAWTFKRSGFLTPHVTARLAGSEADVAVYEPNWTSTKGRLTVGGEVLELKTGNFWATQWMVLDPRGAEIMRLKNQGVLHHGAVVEVSEAGRARADIALLLPFVWYILLLHMQDSAAVVAAT